MRITHRVAWWLTVAVFVFMLTFLVTTTACMGKRYTTYHNPLQDGWAVKGSAVPWHDHNSGVCATGYYMWYRLSA
jgi:hypothetical protein